MTSSEHVRFAVRRSCRLIVICAAVGVVAMLAIGQLLGTQYQATSSVVVQDNLQAASQSESPTSADALTDATNAATLAETPAFAQYLASVLREHDLKAIQDAISVQQTGTSNIVEFTASATTAVRARTLANAARTAFPAFSAGVSMAPITAAERGLAARAAHNPQVQSSIDRLKVLAGISGNVTPLSSATSANKTRPRPSREVLEGLVVGLVVGLLIMALREGLDSRARVSREIEIELDLAVWGLLPRPRASTSSAHAPGSEALRITRLIEERRNAEGGTVIAIATAGRMRAEGRTWVAATLATALMQQSGTVCAVDDGSGGLMYLLRSETSTNGNGNGNGNGDGRPPVPSATVALSEGPAAEDRSGAEASETSARVAPVKSSTDSLGGHQRRLMVLPAWSTSGGLEQLRSRFDWVIIDAPWPSSASHAARTFTEADAVLLVVTLDSATREELAECGREIDGWPRRADAVILTTAR